MSFTAIGVAFSYSGSLKEVKKLLSKVFNGQVSYIPKVNWDYFSTVVPGNVTVDIYPGVCSIENIFFADFLENTVADLSDLYRHLGCPKVLFLYMHADAGGTFGYSVALNGVRVRSRLQTTGIPRLPPLLEVGELLPFEKLWSEATITYEEDVQEQDCGKIYSLPTRGISVSEYYLTSQMLRDGLHEFFGVVPFDTPTSKNLQCYRISWEPTKPWWKFW